MDIGIIHTIGEYAVTHIVDRRYFVLPKDIIFPWRKLEYKEYEIWQPNKAEEFFRVYYGENWSTPQENWKWSASKFHIEADSFEEAVSKHK